MKLAEARERFGKPKPATPIVVVPEPPEPATDLCPWGDDEFVNLLQRAADLDPEDELEPEGMAVEPSPFHSKTVAFTGKLRSMTRKDAIKKVCLRGAFIHKTIMTSTDFLVVGKARRTEKLSSKHERAMEFAGRGLKIQTIEEEVFLRMLDGRK